MLAMLSESTRDMFDMRAIKYVCTYPAGRWQALFRPAHPEAVSPVLRIQRHCRCGSICGTRWLSLNMCRGHRLSASLGKPSSSTRLRDDTMGGPGVLHRVVRLGRREPLSAEVVAELRSVEAAAGQLVGRQAGDAPTVEEHALTAMAGRQFPTCVRNVDVRLCTGLRDGDRA